MGIKNNAQGPRPRLRQGLRALLGCIIRAILSFMGAMTLATTPLVCDKLVASMTFTFYRLPFRFVPR